jgi:hypothetical protein
MLRQTAGAAGSAGGPLPVRPRTPEETLVMHHRRLGSTGLNVSVLGYGASPPGGVFRATDDAEGVRYALEFWITPFDYAGPEGPRRAVESDRRAKVWDVQLR